MDNNGATATSATSRGTVPDVIGTLEGSGWTRAEILEAVKGLRGNSEQLPSADSNSGGGGLVSWLLHTALPAAIVLGTGVVAVYLTGGKDEVPLGDGEGLMVNATSSSSSSRGSRDNQSDGFDGGRRPLDYVHDEDDEDGDETDDHRERDLNEPPEWVTEVCMCCCRVGAEKKRFV